jgi:flagellar biosynthesis/type III secretory pathway M-ring protein FliF/YscJ
MNRILFEDTLISVQTAPTVPTVTIVVASVFTILVVAIAAIVVVECGLRSKKRRKPTQPENEQNTAMDQPQQQMQPDGSNGFSLHKYNTIKVTVDNHSYDKPEPPNEEIYQNVTWR